MVVEDLGRGGSRGAQDENRAASPKCRSDGCGREMFRTTVLERGTIRKRIVSEETASRARLGRASRSRDDRLVDVYQTSTRHPEKAIAPAGLRIPRHFGIPMLPACLVHRVRRTTTGTGLGTW